MSRQQVLFKRVAAGPGVPAALNPNTIPGWIAIHDSRSITPLPDLASILVWPDTSGNGRNAVPYLGFTGAYRTGNSAGGTPTQQPTVEFTDDNTMTYYLPAPGVIDTALGFNYICWMRQLNVVTLDQMFLNGPVAENFQARSVDGTGVAVEMNVDGAGAIVANPSSDPMTVGNHVLEFVGVPPWGLAAGGHTEIWQDGRRVARSNTAGWTTRPNTQMFFSEVKVEVQQRIAWAGYINRDLGEGTRAGIRRWLIREFGETIP